MRKLFVASGCFGVLFWLGLIVANFAAYIYSLVYSFKHLSLPNEGFVLIASIFPPIGVIHGWLLWFGVVAQ